MAAPMGFNKVSKSIMFLRKISQRISTRAPLVHSTCVRKYSSDGSEVRLLQRGDQSIAYRVVEGGNPGVVFCPGFQSNMMGVKANALEQYCKQNELAYVRFDYRGCGQSSGRVQDATLSDWKQDLLAVLDNLTAGPQVLVGSSIGGLLMLEAASHRPNRIHSLIGIATAADFAQRLISNYPKEVQEQIEKKGIAEWSSDHHSYVMTQKFLDDAKSKHDVLSAGEIQVTAPVRLLHGMEDDVVPFDVSLRVAEALWSNDVNVTLSKLSEHRFSQPEDVQMLFETLDVLVHGAHHARELAITSWSAFTVYSHPKKIIREAKT